MGHAIGLTVPVEPPPPGLIYVRRASHWSTITADTVTPESTRAGAGPDTNGGIG